MPEGVTGDSVKPVSILTNRSNSNTSTVSDAGEGRNVSLGKIEEISGRCGPARHPNYEPVNGHDYVNPQKLIQKLQLVTKSSEKEGERDSDRDVLGERREQGGSHGPLRTPLTATSVSFTVPEHQDKVIAHRLSISTRPSSTKLGTPTTVASSSEAPPTLSLIHI